MSRTALPREGTIVFDKRVTIPIALTLCGLVAGAGMGYATLHARVGHLERDSPKSTSAPSVWKSVSGLLPRRWRSGNNLSVSSDRPLNFFSLESRLA